MRLPRLSVVTSLLNSRKNFATSTVIMSAFNNNNPFLVPVAEYERYGGLPPFDLVKTEHYKQAFEVGMSTHLEELKAIATSPDAPTFENTFVAFDKAGSLLLRVGKVFHNLCSSHCPPDLQSVQTEMAPLLAAHRSATFMFPGLFDRIDKVHEGRHGASAPQYSPEQMRLIERIHLDFVRSGSRFDAAAQARYKTIMTDLAGLTTKFSQHILGDESTFTIDLTEADLSGLPSFLVQAAKQAAVERSKPEGTYVITLSRSSVEPFLTFSDRRDLREKAWRAWTCRGELDPSRDCRQLAVEILAKRAEQASMHGYQNFAEYATSDTMAKKPEAVMELLERVWAPAKVSADRERTALEAYAKQHGGPANVEAWDWRYYAEKVRTERYDLAKEDVMPYFSLDRMTEAVFDCANQLFGLKFIERKDLVAYHPDVKTYEVRETAADGQDRLVGLFLHDNYLRQHKKSGAWMSDYRSQSRTASADGSSVTPVIVNNNNFAKGDSVTLLSFDDATTLFHEFGHGMHGMLSDVTYDRLAGTSVLKDFVELPSQLFEHWLSQPEVLKKWARHYETNEPIPDALLKKITDARNFNKGFETVEYTISALIDQSLHKLSAAEIASLDLNAFEQKELARLGMPAGIIMRHRPPHFQHIFATSSYAAAYYVYLWAEVLDADGFEAFLETGNCFDKTVAARVRKHIYSSGNSVDPQEAFRLFRGRDPVVEPMLTKKGLLHSAN